MIAKNRSSLILAVLLLANGQAAMLQPVTAKNQKTAPTLPANISGNIRIENATNEAQLFTTFADSGKQDTSGNIQAHQQIILKTYNPLLKRINITIWYSFAPFAVTCKDIPTDSQCHLTTVDYNHTWLTPVIKLSPQCLNAKCQ